MSDARIRSALRQTDTRDVVISPGALATVDDVVTRMVGDHAVMVVADQTTWRIAGEQVQGHLEAAGRATATPYIFSSDVALYAEYGNVDKLRTALARQVAVPVAVGSGTLNDLVKRAAYELERPYLSVATAASMDGYAAFGASLSVDGYKQTMTCPAPLALLADLDLLTGAPVVMTASGYGDLLGKITAGADWLVADALDVEPIDPTAWSLVQGPLRDAIGQPAELAAGDQMAMGGLIEGLVLSGLAMQVHASSRPGSGAEHQFSHLWEMEGLGRDLHPPLSHGFKVGLGSIAVAALYERILGRDLATLDVDTLVAQWPTPDQAADTVAASHPDERLAAAAVTESVAKHATPRELARRLDLLRGRWPALRARLGGQLLPAERLAGMLRAAGCPTRPSDIGLTGSAFRDTYGRARTIRRRYTVLDLAAETGLLEECVEELFAPGGFWAAA